MIKLDSTVLGEVSAVYKNKIVNKITEVYNQVKQGQSTDLNPFTNQPFLQLFEKEDELDLTFVEDLLTQPFDDLCEKYSVISNYLRTCKFVYYSDFQIDKELKRRNIPKTTENRKQFRKEYVGEYNNPWIEEIITSHESNYVLNNQLFKALIDDIEVKLDDLNQKLKMVIDYGLLESDLRHELLSNMGIEVCPYCNRQYISNYIDEEKKKSTADLDHFLPKSIFQLFSLSLYNFVPSCQVCNSRFKLAKGTKIIYPYEIGFEEETYFSVKLKSESNIGSLTGNNTIFDLDLIVNSADCNKIDLENNIELFRLEKIYQSHKEYVRELLYKKHAWSNTYNHLLNQLFLEMELDPFEINLFLYGNSLKPEDFSKRPLSKLAYDIVNKN